MKGHKTGLADWEIIKTVKQALKIPVFANGNILYDDDVVRCLEKTGVDGVMTAEGNLYNPAIFTGIHHPVWMLAEEYLEICKSHPNSANIGAIRGHLFKIFAPCLADFPALRTKLASIRTMDGFDEFTAEMKKGLLAANGGVSELDASAVTVDEKGIKMLPNWVAQPHLRQPLVEGARKDAEANGAEKKNADLMEETMKGSAVSEATSNKRPAEGEADGAPKKTKKQRQSSKLICSSCPNVGSEKCSHRLCKPCCKKKLKEDLGMTCEAHGKVYGKKGEKTSNNTDATTVTSTE
ncbi:tRNA-dihydrouridine(16/17) synthase [NAD(P)(+)]-like protein [Irineochytrium annulatum]|nr:tRNA-dihydrouridine(16/17) synthase [NAD(P)(+)]-like protein [Irineochytrium annulatum]